MTEWIPLYWTALAGTVLCLLFRVAAPVEILRCFFDPILFLFLGSFLIAKAMHVHQLDRRIAFGILSHPWVEGSAAKTIWAFSLVAWLLAMWLGITSSVAILFPVAWVLSKMHDAKFTTAMLLMLPYAAAAGALATPVGTPPNLIGLAWMEEGLGVRLGFFQWMFLGLPVAVALLGLRFGVVMMLFRPHESVRKEREEKLLKHYADLGLWTTAQKRTLAVFILAVLLWILPGLIPNDIGHSLTPSLAAIISAAFLFILPQGAGRGCLLSWRQALDIDWRTILLFGGGMVIGHMIMETGLGALIGRQWIAPFAGAGLAVRTGVSLVTAVVISEVGSNTASANMLIPIIVSVSSHDSLLAASMVLAATFGSSLGFMLPVATPALAMVYGSKAIRLKDVVRAGFIVDLLGIPLVWVAMTWLLPKVLPLF